MIGSFRWNIAIAAAGTVLTFAVSVSRNPVGTALLGSLYSFAILFVFGFALRWFLGSVVGLNDMDSAAEQAAPKHMLGQQVDLRTPDELELPEIAGAADPAGFEPLKPPKLRTRETADPDPEEVVKVIRHMSEE